MKQTLIKTIEQSMLKYLNDFQLQLLHKNLETILENVDFTSNLEIKHQFTNEELEKKFLSAKNIEGCSQKTLHYYHAVLNKMMSIVTIHVTQMTTDDLREYLSDYQKINNCSKTNIDNIRRIISSFFFHGLKKKIIY